MNKDSEEFMNGVKSELQSLASALSGCLMKINPEYESKKAWNGLGFKQGQNYSCMIVEYKDHIKLMIWRGVNLKDPDSLLEGKGHNTKHIKFFSVNDINCNYIKSLLNQQNKLFQSGVKWE